MSDEHGEYDQDQMPAAAPATVLPRAAEDSTTPPEGAVEAPQAASEEDLDDIAAVEAARAEAAAAGEAPVPMDIVKAKIDRLEAILKEDDRPVRITPDGRVEEIDPGQELAVESDEQAAFADLLPQMPPIDSANHPLPLHDPHWHAIKQWARREIWMAERGFSLAARERNNP